MGITIDGLVTGLDTGSLIEELLAIQKRPIELVQEQVKTAAEKKTAYLSITAKLLGLQHTANKLGGLDIFSNVQDTSAASGTTTITEAGSGTVGRELQERCRAGRRGAADPRAPQGDLAARGQEIPRGESRGEAPVRGRAYLRGRVTAGGRR